MRLRPPPGKRLVAEWAGLRVRSRVPMRNSLGEVPAGTLFTVESSIGGTGLHLKTSPCPHCGISMRISKVSDQDVMVVADDPPPVPVI